jgi:hypothetical protein
MLCSFSFSAAGECTSEEFQEQVSMNTDLTESAFACFAQQLASQV